MAKIDKTSALNQKLQDWADTVGNFLVDAFNYVALFAIGGAIVWSAVMAFLDMAFKGGASIHDILLLFIYLELGAMVGIYFKTFRMPVRFLLYVSITVLTRVLIVVVNEEHAQPDESLLFVAGAILLIALATLIIRFGSHRFPSAEPPDRGERLPRADTAPPEPSSQA